MNGREGFFVKMILNTEKFSGNSPALSTFFRIFAENLTK